MRCMVFTVEEETTTTLYALFYQRDGQHSFELAIAGGDELDTDDDFPANQELIDSYAT